jgi:hypothetical protein
VSKEALKMTPPKLDISCGDRKISLSVPVYQPSIRRAQMLEALAGLVDEAKYMLRAQRGKKQAVTA